MNRALPHFQKFSKAKREGWKKEKVRGIWKLLTWLQFHPLVNLGDPLIFVVNVRHGQDQPDQLRASAVVKVGQRVLGHHLCGSRLLQRRMAPNESKIQ